MLSMQIMLFRPDKFYDFEGLKNDTECELHVERQHQSTFLPVIVAQLPFVASDGYDGQKLEEVTPLAYYRILAIHLDSSAFREAIYLNSV